MAGIVKRSESGSEFGAGTLVKVEMIPEGLTVVGATSWERTESNKEDWETGILEGVVATDDGLKINLGE